jgi:ectoine hydroxylase-related dioxygenase (phytanoyl-CoA dioxygenase family)
MNKPNENFEKLTAEGYVILRTACDDESLKRLYVAFSDSVLAKSKNARKKKANPYAMRNILRENDVISALKGIHGLKERIKQYLEDCIAVRGLYFDKPFRANWSVPWHQDLTIAVDSKAEISGFKSWTNKAGVFHVEPPIDILNAMITARIHLDDADEGNGALCIIPKSHLQGHIPVAQVREIVKREEVVRCDMKRGDIMLMKPLLLHSSRSSETGRRRRVVHIEFNSQLLPSPLNWRDRIKLSKETHETFNHNE